MGRYVLSRNAQRSVQGIKTYSIKNFGKRQTELYLEALRSRMQSVADRPELGTPRNEIQSGYYSCFQGSHTIYYYRVDSNNIGIIDVLHQSMEPERHLGAASLRDRR